MRLLAIALLFLAPGLQAEVLHSKQSALKLAFPNASSVHAQYLFVSGGERSLIEKQSGSKLESRMVTAYVGLKDERVLGYAFIDAHRVRTMPETLLVKLSADGRVEGVHVLAFHEPSEYRASRRWLRQFEGHSLSETLRVGGDIVGIAGASLTSNAAAAAVRRSMAVYEVLVRGRASHAQVPSTPGGV